MKDRRVVASLQLAAAALLFSTGGAAIKATTLTASQTAAGRSAIAAILLILVIPEARRRWTFATLVAALAFGGTLTLFVHATKMTTAANAIFLQSTSPLYLLAIGPLLLKERLKRIDLWMGLLMAAGMAFFMLGQTPAQSSAPNPVAGNLLALASGLTWALTVTGIRYMAREEGGSALPVVVLGNLLAFAFALPGAGALSLPSLHDAAILLYLGCFQVGLAYWFLNRGLRHVPVFQAALILMLEPVSNPIWTWLVHGERVGVWAACGAAAICAGIGVHALSGQEEPDPVPPD